MSAPASQGDGPQNPPPRPDLSILRDDDEYEYRPRRGRFIKWGIVLLLVAAAVFAFYRVPPDQYVPFLMPEVETTTVQRLTPEQASTVLTATGYTYARVRAAVGAKIIGRITELHVDEGDAVAAGDVIAVLDSDDLEAAVRRAQASLIEATARLADARREEARQRRIVEAGVAPSADLDAAVTQLQVTRAQLGTARANLESIEAQLAYTVIHAPVDGVVIERTVEVGEMVAPGGFTSQQATGALVRIADPTSLEVEADINESFIARIQLGQPATIKVDAVPDHEYHGTLRQIVPTADRQRAVVQVKVTIDDRDARLVPDMSCSVTFLQEGVDETVLQADPKILVAAEAVASDDGGDYVLLLRDGQLERAPIELGLEQDGNQFEVLSGLRGGEVVVRQPTPELTPGLRVREAS
ncbi:MAG: efflux RND transporter periplasmic adaptor subunit [Acidobacteriota bacterium]|nr:efflux RND transporter periplasmic adaptor subunit [Acidobacteriota bacterium]